MGTLADLETSVLCRLEENEAGAPTFWIRDEIRAALVESLFETALATGEPQVRRTVPATIVAGSTLQAMPADAIAILKIETQFALWKTSVWDLDQTNAGWQNDTADAPDQWFPVGLSQWGIYPKLNADVQAILTVVSVPVAPAMTYTGAEMVPYQDEYLDAFVDYADHVLRLKDSNQAFLDSFATYGKFLQKCEELNRFGYRKGSLRFSRALGAGGAAPSQVEQK